MPLVPAAISRIATLHHHKPAALSHGQKLMKAHFKRELLNTSSSAQVSLVANAMSVPRNVSLAACLPLCNYEGHHSRKRQSKKSMATAALPKATLLFSLLLPAVKLLLKIMSCTALSPILQPRRCSAQH